MSYASVFCCVILWEVKAISKLAHQINEDIRDKEIRLIAEDGEQLGVMSAADALNIAYDKDLDLVKISPGAKPPVCKIMDYGKFKFEQSKREKEAKRNQHVVEIKEIRMSPVIDTNDFNVKLRNGHKFLNEGNRLKVTIRFRGRQMAHTEIGAAILERFVKACDEIATLDKNPKMEGRNMSMFLSPRAQKLEKAEKPAASATEDE
ncbi:MAG: translation initiation factor IF-3 [Oscillospiraceae bacterium]|nr:translation initiation factor IF-3 [Oscillospiraceae bacterium]